MTTPKAIRIEASISHGPRRNRSRPLIKVRHLRTAPNVIPRSRCLRSRMVKTMTGTRKIVAPAATAGQSLPRYADDRWDERRRGLRRARGQKHRKRVFVPGKDQAEDRGRRDAGGRLRQHHFVEGLEPRVAVDQGCFFVLNRDLVDEPFQAARPTATDSRPYRAGSCRDGCHSGQDFGTSERSGSPRQSAASSVWTG